MKLSTQLMALSSTIRRGGIFVTIVGLVALMTFLGSWYTITEGHVGVVKRFSKAVYQVGPGLHFKVPFIDAVDEFEVRQRKNTEDLSAATANQLPVTARVSLNWTANETAVMDLFIRYGSLAQFEERVLDPKLRNAAKAAISRFPADKLISNREMVVQEILQEVTQALEGFPVTVNSPQLEDLALPQQYLDSVMQKEKAREDSEREAHNLERQRLVAQQAVNTAQAAKDSNILEAQGEAEAVRLKASAEAEAIQKLSVQLAQNPQYIAYIKAKQWNGALPNTVLGTDTAVMLGK